MTTHKLSSLASVAVLAALTACSSPPAKYESVPSASNSMPAQSTMYGRVADIDTVSRTSHAGTILGGVIGAAVGSQIGSGSGRTAATGLGALGGAVAGHEIEKRRADEVYRVTVRFDDGSTHNFDFERVGGLRVGDRVKWENGQIYQM
jgi:outer membrane lipoprotein SlyB